MEELAYSFHLGNDKNKTKKARQVARTSKTGTTSFSNNGIQTAKQLSKVFNHNYRLYDNKQTRDDRKINNYFDKISNNDKSDLACEIIIELGDMEFWEDKNKDYKLKMNEVFKEQIDYLEQIVPNFKIANAVAHFDEHSPHLHIVGVPFKKGNKNGMEITVGKSAIFTKDSLKVIQDKMRINCIENFNKFYEKDLTLKQKRKGKNFDLKSSEMEGYKKTEKALKKEIKELEEVKNINTEIINKQVQEKSEIEEEIVDKKKYSNKIILKDKASLLKENESLKKQLDTEKSIRYQSDQRYNSLKEKTDYLIEQLKKVIDKLPKFIKQIVESLFIYKNIDIKYFKQQYDPEYQEKSEKEKNSKFSLFKTKQKENNTYEDDYENDKEQNDFDR